MVVVSDGEVRLVRVRSMYSERQESQNKALDARITGLL